jgi:hypothetical protein
MLFLSAPARRSGRPPSLTPFVLPLMLLSVLNTQADAYALSTTVLATLPAKVWFRAQGGDSSTVSSWYDDPNTPCIRIAEIYNRPPGAPPSIAIPGDNISRLWDGAAPMISSMAQARPISMFTTRIGLCRCSPVRLGMQVPPMPKNTRRTPRESARQDRHRAFGFRSSNARSGTLFSPGLVSSSKSSTTSRLQLPGLRLFATTDRKPGGETRAQPRRRAWARIGLTATVHVCHSAIRAMVLARWCSRIALMAAARSSSRTPLGRGSPSPIPMTG